MSCSVDDEPLPPPYEEMRAQPTKKPEKAQMTVTSAGDAAPPSKSQQENKESAAIRRLAEENAKLKTELRQFDADFFEELEDLKYNYKKLNVCVNVTYF